MRSLSPSTAVPDAIAEQWPVRLVAAWGFSLSMLAGFINAHAFLTAFKVPVSHMSGTVSRLGLDVGAGEFNEETLVTFSILVAFFAGAVLSGAIIGHRVLLPGRRYGAVLALEGVILLLAAWMFGCLPLWGTVAVALACGLQNAMASSYLGLVLRTTHITGVMTDLGTMLGHWARGHQPSWGKAGVLLSIFAGFMAGGVAAAALFHRLPFDPLWALGGALLFIGATYYAYRVWLRRRLGDKQTLANDE